MNISTKQKQPYRYRQQTTDYQWGEGRREEQYRGRGLIVTSYYKISYKDIFYKTVNKANIL